MIDLQGLIDTIFGPIKGWLSHIVSFIQELSVPVSRPFDPSNYLAPLKLLGPYWFTFVTTVCFLSFVYIVAFLIVSYQGMYIRFKDSVKWW